MLAKTFAGISPLKTFLTRQISTQFTIPPEIVKKIYENTQAPFSDVVVPDLKRIGKHQKKLEVLYREDKDFKKFADNLYKAYNNPNVKSIAISFERQTNLDGSEKNPYFQPTLVMTSLMGGIGIVPFYNDENFPAFAVVNKDSTSVISGHQDSMFLDPNDKHLNLIPILLLANGYSQSNAKTWVKESPDIISEFKDKYPSSYGILTKINFTCRSKNVDEIGNHAPHKIIGERDEINFVSNFIYSPIPTDLTRFNISKAEANLSILRFKEAVNSEKNRHEFVVNNRGVQFLLVKNKDALHGRDEVEEDNKGNRYVIGIPVYDEKPSASSIARIDSSKIDHEKDSKFPSI
jgi:hypothetical protein